MTKKYLFFFLFTMTCFILSSCEDAKLAKAVDGKWEANITLKDEYGTPYTQRQIYDFKYQESNDKNGGIVTESTITSMTEEVDDIEVSYTATSTIKGEWEVIFGDLYFTYNLSTLDVAITNVDYQLSENADFSTKMDYAEAAIGMALLGQELINKDELTEDIRKNAYQSFYEDYESSNNEGDGSYYEDLKIGNNVMSFKTSDIGRMELKRVKTSAKRNKTEAKNKSSKKYPKGSKLQGTIETILKQCDKAHNEKSYSLFNALYADNVLFYGQKLNMEHCIANKQALLDKTYKHFVQHSDNVHYYSRNDGSVLISFDKNVEYDGKSKVFPSYLVIERNNNENWKITVESDKITDRNLQKNI